MPIVMGPPAFITLSNIRTAPTNTGFTLTFDTDQPCLMAMDYWGHDDPSLQGLAGSVLEGLNTTHHSITTNALPAGNHTGYYLGYSLRLDANDSSGKTLRSQQGMVQLTGARSSRNQTVPVRWNTFGDGSAPPGGGGIGNWSTYKWAQYNPKGTTYPTP